MHIPRALRAVTWVLILTSATFAEEPRIGGAARLEAWELHRKLADESPFKSLAWQRLGPKFAGGRIESIEIPAGVSNTIYAGVGAGGIWKTVNGGLSWQPIFQHESTFAIGDLAIAPQNPNIIWAGTGEAHLSGTSFAGTGVFKSTDAGKTWTNMGLHESAHIGQILIDPDNSDTVFVACMGRSRAGGQRGIFKTTDGGKTFRRVLEAGERVAFVDLVMDSNQHNYLYTSAWDRGNGKGSGVYRSSDRGETWTRLAGGLPDQDVGRVAIDVARSQPGVLYALTVDRASPNLRRRGLAAVLYRSDDRGETWKRTHPNYVPTYVGWDFCDVRVAPDDADQVYIGGLRLVTSTDGGRTFHGEGGLAVARTRDTVFRLHAHRGIGMHLDVHDIRTDPAFPDRLLLGNDGGLFQSWDRGQTWLHLNNLPIAEFYRIHLDNERPFRIWGGTQDNASFVGPSSTRFQAGDDDAWEHVFLDPWAGGDGFATFPDPNDATIAYFAQQQGELMRSRLGQLRPERRIRPRGEPGDAPLRWAWDTPFFASQHPGPTVLYCAAQRVFRSDDRGESWTAVSPDLGGDSVLALAESPLDPKRLVAGVGRGEIHFTSDGGQTWKSSPQPLPRKTVRDVVASFHDPQRVYVVLSGKSASDSASYLFETSDFGETFRPIAGNLPHESCNAIAEDPATPGLLFVGTDLGVYATLNGGARWESLCHTLPTAPVVDVAVHGRDGALVAATHGLSLFLLEIEPLRRQAGQ